MEAPLAIYEALLQAEVPAAAARDAAEKLEKDMTTALAIRHDLQQMDAGVRHDLQQLDARITHDLQQLDARITRDLQQLDARITRDLQQLDARVRHDIQRLDTRVQLFEEKLDSRLAVIDERFISLEQRLVIKLGALMAVLMTLAVGAMGVLPTLLR